MDLVKQPTRDIAQVLGLAGQDAHGLLRLGADLFRRLLHHLRVVGENLVELRGLLAESLLGHARVLTKHRVGLGGPLAEGSVNVTKPCGQ